MNCMKHNFTLENSVLQLLSPRLSNSLGSLTSECNSPLLYSRNYTQTVNIQFALVSFPAFFFLGEKVTTHCIDVVRTPMPTSPNDTESINGMVSSITNQMASRVKSRARAEGAASTMCKPINCKPIFVNSPSDGLH